MIANICVNRLDGLDDIWLSCLDLVEREFEFEDVTGCILGARLPDHTDDAMSSVVFDADSEYTSVGLARSFLFLENPCFVQKEAFLGLATAPVRITIFLC
jgi:hypothetical protein